MKFCKDCFYCKGYLKALSQDLKVRDYSQAVCMRTKSYNPVSGQPTYTYCSVERESLRPEACGAEGKHFARPDEQEEWQRDEPQGVTNWDTGWNGVYAEENRNG